MSAILDYLKRLFVEVFDRALKRSWAQVFPTSVALTTLVLKVYFGASMSTDFRRNMLATLWSLPIAIGAYFLAQIPFAIFALDRRRADTIRRLTLEPVKVEIQRMYLSNPAPMNQTHVSLRLDFRVRTGANAVTLCDWVIKSPTFPAFTGMIESVHSLIDRQASVHRTIRIEANDVAEINLTCSFYGKKKEEMRDATWQLYFEDAGHSPYVESIPRDRIQV